MKVLKLAAVLLIICAIVAGVLGAVNAITEGRIAEQQLKKSQAAYAAVLKADAYDPMDFDNTDHPSVDSVINCGDAGYIITSTFSGAQGSITMAVGVDKELKCTGISIIQHSETSGLGANAAADSEIGRSFRAQFAGQGEDISLSNSGGSIDALTGATITSDAVVQAVAESILTAKSIEGGMAA